MTKPTITLTLGGREVSFLTGNMALIRFRRAKGDFAALGSIGNENPSPNEALDAGAAALTFLTCNQASNTPLSFEELAELSGSIQEANSAAGELSMHIPWLAPDPKPAEESTEATPDAEA